MRSAEPIPGNPWPHDMVITVDDFPDTLIRLLWIREAWELGLDGDDLPTLLSITPTPTRASRPDEWESWREGWPRIWHSCLAHKGSPPDPDFLDRLSRSQNGSPERLELLRALAGPSWEDRFGMDAFTDEYRHWRMEVDRLATGLRKPASWNQSPERMSLDALKNAWQAGLSSIVTIPCQGTYTRRIDPSGLLVTVSTRANPERYSDALQQFG